MATIVTRSGKGSPLTNNEVAANFTNLNTDKLEVGGGTLTGALTISSGGLTVNSGTINLGSDSVASTINSLGDVFVLDVDSNANTGGTPNIQFKVSGSEKARLTNSANLLIGESGGSVANSSSATGINLKPNSSSAFSRNGGTPLFLNRLNTDGDILVFRNSGSTVGSIGSTSGSMYIEGNPATGKSGLTFFGAYIEPRDNGASADNAIDLGEASARFKDLHLSGSIKNSSDITLDSAQDIDLDADSGNIKLSDGGTEVGRFL